MKSLKGHLEDEIPIAEPNCVGETNQFHHLWELVNILKKLSSVGVEKNLQNQNLKSKPTTGMESMAPTTADDNHRATRAPPPYTRME